jgi:hypothetical protein
MSDFPVDASFNYFKRYPTAVGVGRLLRFEI